MLVYPSGGTIGTIFSASAEQNSRQPTDISKQKGRLDYIASTFFIVLMESVLCELVSGAISLFYRSGVRFKLLDKLHGIDSTHVQAFRDDLDTRLEPKPCDTKIAYFIK